MITKSITSLFNRDLHKLKTEIDAYQKEENLWKIDKSIANSAGNLCLHLVGNINHFIGAQLGNTGYIRHREQEFSLKDIPKTELIEKIEATITMINMVLPQLPEEDLKKEYPLVVFENPMTTDYFLIHLVAHLDYHLGQINYHRRLLDM